MSLRFGNITLHVRFGVRHLRHRLRQLSFCLIKHCLKGTGIDLKEELTLFDECAFVIILANQVTAHLRLNLRIDVAFERSHPLPLNRHILLNDRRDFDHRWWRRGWSPHLTAAAAQGMGEEKPTNKSCRYFLFHLLSPHRGYFTSLLIPSLLRPLL